MANVGTARDLVKSNTANDKFSMLMVTDTSGSVIYDQENGGVVTITNALTGIWIPVGQAVNVRTASTASGFVVA
jgi:ketopantoate hydroxymethyltransferase